VETLSTIATELPLYLPLHPRTKARMEEQHIAIHPSIYLIEPLGYLDFLWLMANSFVVLTDSGGIQEETTALGTPCLTLRNNTERPITIEEGTNILAGTTKVSILRAWGEMKRCPKTGSIPKYWDGSAAQRCVQVLRNHFFNSAEK
jgi:UDP-N-acetylglucosamine 2-epimerase (non-hydrolysing)